QWWDGYSYGELRIGCSKNSLVMVPLVSPARNCMAQPLTAATSSLYLALPESPLEVLPSIKRRVPPPTHQVTDAPLRADRAAVDSKERANGSPLALSSAWRARKDSNLRPPSS